MGHQIFTLSKNYATKVVNGDHRIQSEARNCITGRYKHDWQNPEYRQEARKLIYEYFLAEFFRFDRDNEFILNVLQNDNGPDGKDPLFFFGKWYIEDPMKNDISEKVLTDYFAKYFAQQEDLRHQVFGKIFEDKSSLKELDPEFLSLLQRFVLDVIFCH